MGTMIAKAKKNKNKKRKRETVCSANRLQIIFKRV